MNCFVNQLTGFYNNKIFLKWVDNLNLSFPMPVQQKIIAPVLTL